MQMKANGPDDDESRGCLPALAPVTMNFLPAKYASMADVRDATATTSDCGWLIARTRSEPVTAVRTLFIRALPTRRLRNAVCPQRV